MLACQVKSWFFEVKFTGNRIVASINVSRGIWYFLSPRNESIHNRQFEMHILTILCYDLLGPEDKSPHSVSHDHNCSFSCSAIKTYRYTFRDYTKKTEWQSISRILLIIINLLSPPIPFCRWKLLWKCKFMIFIYLLSQSKM